MYATPVRATTAWVGVADIAPCVTSAGVVAAPADPDDTSRNDSTTVSGLCVCDNGIR